MSSRVSKIARLPKQIRHQLGQHLEDGRSGKDLVQWLNSQPDVQKIVAEQFNHSPISEQNLSDWKQSGHLEWLRRQEAREAALSLLNAGDDLDLDDAGQRRSLLENFGAILAVEISRLAMQLLEKETDPEKKLKQLCQINRELSQLRRDNDRATRTAITQEKWDAAAERQKQADAQHAREAEKQRLLNRLEEGEKKDLNSRVKFGFGPDAEQKAELYYRLKCDLPVDHLVNAIWPELKQIAPAKTC